MIDAKYNPLLMLSYRTRFVLDNPWLFMTRIVSGFRANQGFLLAGSVAYYTLLSVVPMIGLMMIVLSQVQDPQDLIDALTHYLVLFTPAQSQALVDQVMAFLQSWKVSGIIGLLILLFFSSLAFTVLENAMSVIFFHRVAIKRRHFMVSAIIPYCYILLLALGLLMVSLLSSSLHALDSRSLTLMGHEWQLRGAESVLIYLLGIIGEVLLLSSLYLVMPVGRLALRHALIGGITATLLWEVSRHILVWYFSTLSLVNVIYGTFATAIIILLSLEIAAIIVLLGAQVIAEYERIDTDNAGQQGFQI